ncbi:S8 family serine peptidase [Falsiroseomonas sp. HC035]|uniref:S8 family serine peptidase n=1 Tax=Falsiroseomonas sp. HC035 TaxID=3390999 RepID=UPI003D319EA1
MTLTPRDPLFADQWYLRNTGQSGGTPGMDIRIDGAWRDYSGQGVRIVIIDDGVFHQHPDLAANYETVADFNFVSGQGDATPRLGTYSHGTQVAGFLGAALDGVGLVGVAHGARFTAYNIADSDGNYVTIPQGLNAAIGFDITNNSYGNEVFAVPDNGLDALAPGATLGRGGLGTVHVFAAGNERSLVVLATHGDAQNSPYQITVAATDHDGRIAAFSSPGANVFVAAPGARVLGVDGLETHGYGLTDGTSFATPIVSGVAALVLQANPGLGYRDVFDILGLSAYDTHGAPLTIEDVYRDILGTPTIPDQVPDPQRQAIEAAALRVTSYPWTVVTNGATDWNGGGLTVSHDFGLGQVDARAAVRLAETWNSAPRTTANLAIAQAGREAPEAIPDADPNGISQSVTIETDIRVEAAVVEVNLPHGAIGDLQIRLVSPQGTVSHLIHNPDYGIYNLIRPNQAVPQTELDKGTFVSGGNTASLMSTQVYGESSLGTWTLQVVDTKAGTVGTLEGWNLTLAGAAASADDRYVYTSQYAELLALDPARGVLADTDGGTDTINAAAVLGPVSVDLAPGTEGSIGGASFRIGGGTTIENLYTGDGNDRLFGNDAANHLHGGRGNDLLAGRGGDDLLDGGVGLDAALYEGSRYAHAILEQADGSVILTGTGTDVLRSIEVLVFEDGNTAARRPVGVGQDGFDAGFYLSQNADVGAAGFNLDTARLHYMAHGGLEGRAPNAFFDGSWYLNTYADVAAAGMNPLHHFTQYGHLEDRDSSGFFDSSRYLAANSDVASAGMNPLDHFLRYGVAEGRVAYSVAELIG